eukprot:350857-Chlamydomonas_euryale.AAC.2
MPVLLARSSAPGEQLRGAAWQPQPPSHALPLAPLSTSAPACAGAPGAAHPSCGLGHATHTRGMLAHVPLC